MIGTPANFPTRVSELVPGDFVIVSCDKGDDDPTTMLAQVVKVEYSRVSSKWVAVFRANDRQFTRMFSPNWQRDNGQPMKLQRVRFISNTPAG